MKPKCEKIFNCDQNTKNCKLFQVPIYIDINLLSAYPTVARTAKHIEMTMLPIFLVPCAKNQIKYVLKAQMRC